MHSTGPGGGGVRGTQEEEGAVGATAGRTGGADEWRGRFAGVPGGRGRGRRRGVRAEEVAEGGAGGPPFAVDFSGLFFTGDGPRLPG